ncbi:MULTISPECIES: cupin domain-containing protein [Pseudofrankia]|uniref:cupin domain-containing protein n=1 Tax=Pseudofrankia TaxID=2994363 RepID=UPI0002DB1A50|nr:MULTISPECIES: cupin domain-containing protein [Pseudofrankia]
MTIVRQPSAETIDRIAIRTSEKDVRELERLLRRGSRAQQENPEHHEHLNEHIDKPWGCEYRVFADDFHDVWELRIEPGHATSVHAHPRKVTYLLCLGGTGEISTLDGAFEVGPGTAVRIGAGAFHGTTNTGSAQLALVEVELPRNKFDLVRLTDSYDRATTAYEPTASHLDGSPLRRAPHIPHAVIRRASPDRRFSYEIRTGMDLYYRRLPTELFHVPIGMSGVVHGSVDVLGGASRDEVATDRSYLSISGAQ